MITNNLSLLIINIFALLISKILEKLFKTPIIDNLRSCLHVLLLKLRLFELKKWKLRISAWKLSPDLLDTGCQLHQERTRLKESLW